MPWRFVATSLAGANVGEILNAKNRGVGLGLRRVETCGMLLRLDNPLADSLLNGDLLVKAYDGTTLRFVGQTIGAEEVNDGTNASVQITCASPLWRLNKRFVGKGTVGYSQGTAGAQVDRGTIMSSMLNAVNTEAHTGIELGTVAASSNTYVAYTPFKRVLEAFTELAQGVAAPDFRFRPQEPQAVSGGTRLGYLDIAGTIGQNRPATIFEYGVNRRNVASYKRQVSLEGMMNAGYALDPAGGAPTSAVDNTSIAAYTRLEDLVPTDLSVAALRQTLVDEHLRVRKNPRQLIEFTPVRDDPAAPGRVPRFGTDYEIGDVVRFRAVHGTTVRVNAMLRIFAIEYKIDEEGAAVPTFTLTAD
jgi:hypothetical protein